MRRPTLTYLLAATLFSSALRVVGTGGDKGAAPTTLRLGFFPNLTHGPALVGLQRGDFARALAPLTVDAKPFNAGPEAMEALFAGALDACFVGPAPAINGYLRSHGEALVIVVGRGAQRRRAGRAQGGRHPRAGQSARQEDRLAAARQHAGRGLARVPASENGLAPKDRGGDVTVLPLANADILSLMKQKQLDGAWVPEPWTSRLVDEAGGELLLDERDRWPDKQVPDDGAGGDEEAGVDAAGAREEAGGGARGDRSPGCARNPDEARKLVDLGLQKWAKKALPEELLDEGVRQRRPVGGSARRRR